MVYFDIGFLPGLALLCPADLLINIDININININIIIDININIDINIIIDINILINIEPGRSLLAGSLLSLQRQLKKISNGN